MVELIRELMPQTKKIAVLGNPNRPGFEQLVDDVVKPAEAAVWTSASSERAANAKSKQFYRHSIRRGLTDSRVRAGRLHN